MDHLLFLKKSKLNVSRYGKPDGRRQIAESSELNHHESVTSRKSDLIINSLWKLYKMVNSGVDMERYITTVLNNYLM
ncbi:hypothetical protein O3M35_001717 [Rhynocoris fuscipes]|uniref:Uncharacterized protein n=1 Tax=Rhynocoris fuscipes TaxID=488301 RepID=A0AAW1CS88_9HEMI